MIGRFGDANIEPHPAVFALMHTARQLRHKRGKIELLARDRELARFELAEVAHLRDERAEARARSFGFLEHLPLLVGERSACSLSSIRR